MSMSRSGVSADLAAELDEGGDPAAGGPGQPSVEGFDAGVGAFAVADLEDGS